jgi:micrococcal nuclease
MTPARSAATIVFSCVGMLSGAAFASEVCAPEAGGSHDVVRVIDGETVLIDDGREVRLIGALAPKPDTFLTLPDARSPAQDTARALEAMVLNRTVSLRYDGRRRDRYGRALAQVYVTGPHGGTTEWVQRALVDQGLARAYALPGNSRCIAELIASEGDARVHGRGIWSREIYRVRQAHDTDDLLQIAGRFAIVEGRVSNVARVQKTTYVNFGTDWRQDFTASIANPIADRTQGGQARLSGLAGKNVRVRGWIERRNGPMVVLASVDEIEVLDQVGNALPGGTSAQPGAPP